MPQLSTTALLFRDALRVCPACSVCEKGNLIHVSSEFSLHSHSSNFVENKKDWTKCFWMISQFVSIRVVSWHLENEHWCYWTFRKWTLIDLFHFLPDGRITAYLYTFWYTVYHLACLCNNFMASRLVDVWSSVFIRGIIYKFLNVCPFDYTAFVVSGKVSIS